MACTCEETIIDTDVVSVVIVDDQASFRSAARTVVGLAPGFRVAAEAETGEQGVDLAAGTTGALFLMDINMPGINGIEATRRITAADPTAVVILMSTYTAEDLPSDATTCGAASYVHKEDLFPDILQQVWDEQHPTT
jgi:two-component system, NarL family, invasion response regulator UvrY